MFSRSAPARTVINNVNQKMNRNILRKDNAKAELTQNASE